MYGLLLEAITHWVQSTYGEEKWEEIRKLARVDTASFATHQRYSEKIIPDIARASSLILGLSEDDVMDAFGVCFVSFVGQYGYDRILSVLGRNVRDFLNGLDNLHEYLRFSYPKLKPPSFFCTNESSSGLTLHYRSKRKGFIHYVKGQIRQVGEVFYRTKIRIDVVSAETTETMTHVIFRLHFNNAAYREKLRRDTELLDYGMPLDSAVFFELFPFHIVFSRSLEIRSIGTGIAAVLPQAKDHKLNEIFILVRPLVKLQWNDIMAHTNNVFELRSMSVLRKGRSTEHIIPQKDVNNETVADSVNNERTNTIVAQNGGNSDASTESSDDEIEARYLRLKGQMMFMADWEAIIFLATPIMGNLDAMFKAGLYINDLSMHDSSRDLVLAGTQQSAELKLALDQEQRKSKILEESMRRLDAEMKRTDQLLYQMIPKPVADRLRRGEPAISTCQVFENVTILFSDVVGFTTICSQISPMEVVSMLNAMYTKFDTLSERHGVYKVETIGDAYMVVAGAPEITQLHAFKICDMALGMMESMQELRDPSTGGHMKIRVGVHSGTAVAGVVGIKMPRYCLFGDTVNTASRMETNGEAMKIHISQTTHESIRTFPYECEERGSVNIKGKGSMKTYWLKSKNNQAETSGCPFANLIDDKLVQEKDKKIIKSSDSFDLRSLYSPVSFEDCQQVSRPPSGHRHSLNDEAIDSARPDKLSIKKHHTNGSNGIINHKSVHDKKEPALKKSHIFRLTSDGRSSTCIIL
ncbi:hypothetical protein FSP39_019823 [Pinctada imbricata]|uniref:guanylate cyclase n=1 Tax=Pinctada imbricata TaxID=66713 RepID=A0AA89CBA6_PINIB|nr:hypothetical protein FSP39_019823 [Pinctada imbricata]